jgi:(p)ppGpp synthase/HD superfamily hydrolase
VISAQTPLQLFAQLRHRGYGADDLALIHRAHGYACELFSGAYRASGKPFVCHLIGTAGVLASVDARPAVVAAGLLHAAYPQGEFGAGWFGRSDRKRAQVRARVGAAVEALIDGYAQHAWDPAAVAALVERLDRGRDIDREVAVMRLANELDDHLDLGILYCRDAAARIERIERMRPALLDLAQRLEQVHLRDALDSAFRACLSADVPDMLRTPHDVSFVVPPISRLRWRLRSLLTLVTGTP